MEGASQSQDRRALSYFAALVMSLLSTKKRIERERDGVGGVDEPVNITDCCAVQYSASGNPVHLLP